MILAAKGTRDYTDQVTAANDLAFLDVSRRLADPAAASDLESFNAALQRDYAIVTALACSGPQYRAVEQGAEERMLRVLYGALRLRYALFRGISTSRSSRALSRMCDVVGYFANVAGESAFCGR